MSPIGPALGTQTLQALLEGHGATEEAKAEYLSRLPTVSQSALALKFADRTENLCDLIQQPDTALAAKYVHEAETYFVPFLVNVEAPLGADLALALREARTFAES